MADPDRLLRARSLAAFWKAGVLLGAVGLTAAGLENLSFGHAHPGEHPVHHHHVYSGAHDHPVDRPGDDHEEPAPDDQGGTPRRAATVSAAPPLFQPAAASVLAAPLAPSTPLMPELAPPRVARPTARHASPRAPPASAAVIPSVS